MKLKAVEKQVRTVLWHQVRNQVIDLTADHVFNQVWHNVRQQVLNIVENQINVNINIQVDEHTP
jgi:hypothetical protein